jgi:hypothetical protein
MVSERGSRQPQFLLNSLCAERLKNLQNFTGRRVSGRDCHMLDSSFSRLVAAFVQVG